MPDTAQTYVCKTSTSILAWDPILKIVSISPVTAQFLAISYPLTTELSGT